MIISYTEFGFEILMAGNIKSVIFGDEMPCSMAEVCWRFGGMEDRGNQYGPPKCQ